MAETLSAVITYWLVGTSVQEPGTRFGDCSRTNVVGVNGGGGSGQLNVSEAGAVRAKYRGSVTVTVATSVVAEAPGL